MNILKKFDTFKADWIDVVFIKLGVFTATLFLAKIYSPILSLEWYWYLFLWLIISVRPINSYLKWFKTVRTINS